MKENNLPAKIKLFYGSNFYQLTRKVISNQHDIFKNPYSYLYLANDVDRVRYLKIKYFLRENENVALDRPFNTVQQFFTAFYEGLNIAGIRLPFIQRCFILQEIVSLYKKRFRYFPKNDQPFPPLLIANLINLFDTIRLNKEDQQLLNQQVTQSDTGEQNSYLDDFRLLFSKYNSLFNTDYLDETSLLQLIMEKLNTPLLETIFPQLKTVVFEEVSHFKNIDVDFIKFLKKMGLNVELLFVYGENREIFSVKDHLFEKLKLLADEVEVVSEEDKLTQYLFQIQGRDIDLGKKISITKSINRLQETEDVAAEIKKLVVDDNLFYSDIVVSSPQLNTYRPILETVFDRFKIPFSFFDRIPLIQSFVYKQLILLVELVRNDYQTQIIRNLLNSSFYVYREQLASVQWEKLLNQLRVKKGKNDILKYLARDKEFYAGSIENEDEKEDLETSYDVFIKVLQELYEDVSFLEKSLTTKQFYVNIVRILTKHKKVWYDGELNFEGKKNFLMENVVGIRQFMETLNHWASQISLIFPDKHFTIQELWQILMILGTQQKYNIRFPINYGVQILPLSGVVNRDFGAVFILGMEEGVFPSKGKIELLFEDFSLGELKSFLPRDYLLMERELFLKLIQHPAKRVQFYYPRYFQETPVLPSIFLRELNRVSLENLEKKPTVSLHTPSDVLEYFGHKIKEDIINGDELKIQSVDLPFSIDQSKLSLFLHQISVSVKREIFSGDQKWDGVITPDNPAVSWLDNYFKDRRFSPTQLETYAKCPMIYFFERILGIDISEEAEMYLSTRDKGIIVHNVFYRFYKDYWPDKMNLENLLAVAKKELENISIPDHLLWQLEKEFFLGSAETKGLFPTFWEYESDLLNRGAMKPIHFEWAFGNVSKKIGDVDPFSADSPFVWISENSKFYYKGKIDRIEIVGDELFVTDYKTGTLPVLREMWEGEKLQLPIYLKAAHSFLKKKYQNLQMGGGILYGLKKEQEIQKRITFIRKDVDVTPLKPTKNSIFPNEEYQTNDTPTSLEDFIQRTFNFTVKYIKNIRKGEFPHTEDDKKCRNWDGTTCVYMPLCRVNRKRQKINVC